MIKPKQIFSIILVLVLLLGILMVLVSFSSWTYKTIRSEFSSILDTFLNHYGFYNYTLTAKSIRVFPLGEAGLEGVHLTLNGQDFISLSKVRIGYSVRKLLNKDISGSLLSISVDGVVLALDTLLELVEKYSPQGDASRPLEPPSLDFVKFVPELKVILTNVQLSGINGPIRNIRLPLVSISRTGEVLNGRILADTILQFELGAEQRPASIPCLLDFSITPSSANGKLQFSFKSDNLELKKLDFSFDYDLKNFSASLKGLQGITRCDVSYDFASAILSGYIGLDEFKPGRLIDLPDNLKDLLPASVSGTCKVQSDFTAQGTVASFNVRGTLPLKALDERLAFSLAGSGNINNFSVESLSLANSKAKVSYSGAVDIADLRIDGALSLSYFSEGKESIKAECTIIADRSAVFLYAPIIQTRSGVIRNLTADVFFEPGGKTSFLLECYSPSIVDAEADSFQGKLSLQGSMNGFSLNDVYLTADFSNFPIQPVLGISEPFIGDISGFFAAPVSITSRFTFQKSGDSLFAQSLNTLLAWTDKTDEFLVFGFMLKNDQIMITNIVFNLPDFLIQGTVDASIKNKHDAIILAALSVNSVNYAFEANIYDKAIFITGNNNFKMRIVQDGKYYFASFGLDDFPLKFRNTEYLVTNRGSAYFSGISDWKIQFDTLTIAGGLTRLAASGEISGTGMLFPSVTFSDADTTLDGTVQAEWQIANFGENTSLYAHLSGQKGEALSAELRLQEGILSGFVKADKFPVERLGLPQSYGKLAMRADISGTLAMPEARAFFVLNQKETISTLPYLEAECVYADMRIDFSKIQLLSGPFAFNDFKISFDLVKTEVTFDGEFTFILQGVTKTTRMSMHCLGTGHSAPVAGNDTAFGPASLAKPRDILRFFRLDGAFDSISINEGKYAYWPFSIVLSDESVTCSIGTEKEAWAEFDYKGKIAMRLDKALPLSLSAEGTIQDNLVNIQAADIQVNLPYLFDLLAIPVIAVKEGTAYGSLTISGPLADPDMNGVLIPQNLKLMVPDYSQEEIGPIVEPLYVHGKSMELYQTAVQAGGGMAAVRLDAEIYSWIPSALTVAVSGYQDKPLKVQTVFSGLQITGTVVPDLFINVSETETSISGQIHFAEGDVLITPGVFDSSSHASSSSNLKVMLQFVLGTKVYVYFPFKQFPILHGQIAPRSFLNILYDGYTEDYSIKGTINLRNGNVLYIKRNFYLKKASMEFNENNRHFSPRLTLEAESRTVYNGNQLLVKLSAQNSPLDNLVFRLESVPTLSELEIARALGQDLLQVQQGGIGLGQVLIENSDLIPQLDLTSQLESQVIQLTGLDVFYFQSQLLQKIILDLSGLSLLSGNMTLGDYLDNTSIVGGKYLTDQLYLQVSLQLMMDPLSNIANLSLLTTIGLEWMNPYFTIWWQLQPQNPDTLFITDQSLGIMWRIEIK